MKRYVGCITRNSMLSSDQLRYGLAGMAGTIAVGTIVQLVRGMQARNAKQAGRVIGDGETRLQSSKARYHDVSADGSSAIEVTRKYM